MTARTPLPHPDAWRRTNPRYETTPPRASRIRVDPCDPSSRVVDVVEIDGGKAYELATYHERQPSKGRG